MSLEKLFLIVPLLLVAIISVPTDTFAETIRADTDMKVLDICYGHTVINIHVTSEPNKLSVELDAPNQINNCSYGTVQPIFKEAMIAIDDGKITCVDSITNNAVNILSDCELRLERGQTYNARVVIGYAWNGMEIPIEAVGVIIAY